MAEKKARKTSAAAPRAAATATAPRPAVRKTVTRRRAAATVSHGAAATQAVTGWRRFHRKTKVGRVVEVISRLGEAGAAAPRPADIEKALEESEGAAEFLSKPADEGDEETEGTEA